MRQDKQHEITEQNYTFFFFMLEERVSKHLWLVYACLSVKISPAPGV